MKLENRNQNDQTEEEGEDWVKLNRNENEAMKKGDKEPDEFLIKCHLLCEVNPINGYTVTNCTRIAEDTRLTFERARYCLNKMLKRKEIFFDRRRGQKGKSNFYVYGLQYGFPKKKWQIVDEAYIERTESRLKGAKNSEQKRHIPKKNKAQTSENSELPKSRVEESRVEESTTLQPPYNHNFFKNIKPPVWKSVKAEFGSAFVRSRAEDYVRRPWAIKKPFNEERLRRWLAEDKANPRCAVGRDFTRDNKETAADHKERQRMKENGELLTPEEVHENVVKMKEILRRAVPNNDRRLVAGA